MGIMKFTKVVLQNLFRKPATRMYPVSKRAYFANTRGHIAIEIESCIYCGICVKKCPTHAISIDKGTKCWSIERLKCIQCNSCVETCPKKCLTMENAYTPPVTGSVEDLKESFHA